MSQDKETEEPFVKFGVESRILRELGEQLVSDSQVAMTELIKNAYDADANNCEIRILNESICIKDDGHGMNLTEFKSKWMTIATSNKEKDQLSRHYKRKLTGSKGVGRFAVRFLGKELLINSVAKFEDGKTYKLSAVFDWAKIDESENLEELKIPYTLTKTTEQPGTTLIIKKLRSTLNQDDLREIKSGILSITSPVYSFINDAPPEVKGLFETGRSKADDIDPGFNINLSAGDEGQGSLASSILERYMSKATISLVDSKLTVKVHHQLAETSNQKILHNFKSSQPDLIYYKELKFANVIGCNVYLDIRFFPRRGGMFQGQAFNGKEAWRWVRDNNGIGIYDHGFRIRPYGYKDDDWLKLDRDTAHNERNWQSTLMTSLFPMTEEQRSIPKLNPMIGIPTNYQSIGAVFVQGGNIKDGEGLSPSMDRQGYILNNSFRQLQEISRFAVELIAHFDKQLTLEVEKKERDRLLNSRRDEIQAAINEIKKSPTLTSEDKHRIVSHYVRIRDDIEKVEEYDRESREGLTVMSLLGVVAGFMTHEFQAALMTLESASQTIREAAIQQPSLTNYADEIERTVEYFTGYIDYTKLFVNNIQSNSSLKEYKSLPAINHVLQTFSRFQDERKVNVIIDNIDKDLLAPKIPAAMYQGIIHNLYTNALKALLNHNSNNKLIKIQAWNDSGKRHIIQVMDNGPGIPPEVSNRIWDPLYTTSSTDNNPLGSGMGLGLPLIKKVIETRKGKISLIDAPAGFSTCFRVELPGR